MELLSCSDVKYCILLKTFLKSHFSSSHMSSIFKIPETLVKVDSSGEIFVSIAVKIQHYGFRCSTASNGNNEQRKESRSLWILL